MKRIKMPLQPVRREIPVVNPDPDVGLTVEQARARAEAGWDNRVQEMALKSEGQIILSHTLTFFNLVFVALAVCLAIVGSFKNMTFMIVVVINGVIGCVQEIRAKRAVEKLTLVAKCPVQVLRDGVWIPLSSEEVVRDDILHFGAGDQICADGILRTGQLRVNESLITGEAVPVNKLPGDALRSGSFVVSGSGKVQLTQVGADAYAATLARQAKDNPQAAKSEMMRSLDKLIRVVGIALVPIGVVLFYQEFKILRLSLQESVEATVAALVGMIPEGLYLLTSVAMAASALKLTRRRVLVQDMNCIETLARVDVLCVDKTGTITEPGMEVEQIVPLSGDAPEYLEAVMTAFVSTREAENDTGRALREMFPGESDWILENAIPFSSETKWSAATFREQGTFLLGAPERVLGDRFPELEESARPWSNAGYRVLLVAAYAGAPETEALNFQWVKPLALLVLSNRIRPEAPETFRYFAQQGVAIKIISGDNPAAAAEVAKRAGIDNATAYTDAQTLIADEDFQQAVKKYTVFGRVTPDQKKKLVEALKQQGHTVAMTGDGVNDVLAMREADCAIAMAGGAQAASQVAQLVLLDGDFSAIPEIVGEGRRVINNIQRAAALFLVKNIFSLAMSVITLFTALPYPIVPLHLSVISALTIGVPSFFLAMEPNYERVTGHFLRGVLRRAFPGGLTNIFVVLAAQAYMTVFGLNMEQTATICGAILGVVGLLVLYQVCRPFDRFRKIIWCAMLAGLVICFTALGTLLELRTDEPQTQLVMLTLLVVTPTVFFAVRRVFDWGDVLWGKLSGWRKKRHADL